MYRLRLSSNEAARPGLWCEHVSMATERLSKSSPATVLDKKFPVKIVNCCNLTLLQNLFKNTYKRWRHNCKTCACASACEAEKKKQTAVQFIGHFTQRDIQWAREEHIGTTRFQCHCHHIINSLNWSSDISSVFLQKCDKLAFEGLLAIYQIMLAAKLC